MKEDLAQLPPAVKLLTLINVAQARPTKRQRTSSRDWFAISKKAARTEPEATATADDSVEHGLGLAETGDEVEEEEAGGTLHSRAAGGARS